MSEFDFKSQICTSREQSERLLALGLKKATADCVWIEMSKDDWRIDANGWKAYYSIIEEGIAPAWSLGRLIEMMPMTLIEDRVYHEKWDLNITHIMVLYRNQDQPDEWIGECLGQGMYNNVIDCIEWLIKEGYFNKEYLQEQAGSSREE